MRIHALSTGTVRIKPSAARARGQGLARSLNLFLDPNWTDWLPIHVWVIEHPEGVIVVDTGERSNSPNLPIAQFQVRPEDEVGAQLKRMGINPQEDVKTVVQTHLHGDHAHGLQHFPGVPILVNEPEVKNLQSPWGWVTRQISRLRLPQPFNPTFIPFENKPFGPFQSSHALTRDGSVVIVPTPGHTAGHVSVVVNSEGVFYFLAGDTSYDQEQMLQGIPSGFSSDDRLEVQTHQQIREFARAHPTVYLPSHDPGSAGRLEAKQIVQISSH